MISVSNEELEEAYDYFKLSEEILERSWEFKKNIIAVVGFVLFLINFILFYYVFYSILKDEMFSIIFAMLIGFIVSAVYYFTVHYRIMSIILVLIYGGIIYYTYFVLEMSKEMIFTIIGIVTLVIVVITYFLSKFLRLVSIGEIFA